MSLRLRLALLALATFSISGFLLVTHGLTALLQFEDAGDFIRRATQLLSTGSPYPAFELNGPFDTLAANGYRYPPLFAQLLTPLSLFGENVGKLIWASINGVMLLAAVWVVSGRLPRRDRIILTVLLPAATLPALSALWEGNVGGLLAFIFAVALTAPTSQRALFAIAFGALVKLSPALALPSIFLAAPRTRRVMIVLGGLIALTIASVLVSPVAWAQFPQVLINQLSGTNNPKGNLALGVWLGDLGRALALLIAAATFAASLVFARRRPIFALAAAVTTSLLLPGSLWYHYLGSFIPFLAIAFLEPRARWWGLVALVALDLPSPTAVPLAGMALLLLALWRLQEEPVRIAVAGPSLHRAEIRA